jgi:hypothetical protein
MPIQKTKFNPIWSGSPTKDSWKIQQFIGSGTSSVVESNQTWDTREEAQAAADRANAGDESGLTFSCFADD